LRASDEANAASEYGQASEKGVDRKAARSEDWSLLPVNEGRSDDANTASEYHFSEAG